MGCFPCGYFMFYYRAIKIGFGISSTWLGQTGAKSVKIPSWYEAKFPALLSEPLFTRPSYLHRVCRHLRGSSCLGTGADAHQHPCQQELEVPSQAGMGKEGLCGGCAELCSSLSPKEQLSCTTVSWDNLSPPIDQDL